MDQRTLRRCEFRAGIFKALAHPMRVLMLETLKEKPWCVCELAGALGLEKSVASKHLAQLKAAGLVDTEKRGTLVEYRLVAPCVLDVAACAEGTILANRRRKLDIALPSRT